MTGSRAQTAGLAFAMDALRAAAAGPLILPGLVILGYPVGATPEAAGLGTALSGLAFAVALRIRRGFGPLLLGPLLAGAACWALAQVSYPGAAWLLAPSLGLGIAFVATDARGVSPRSVWMAGAAALGLVAVRFGLDRQAAAATAAAVVAATAAMEVFLTRGVGSGKNYAWGGMAGLATIVAITYVGATTPGASWFGPLVDHGPREEGLVALTFDDGPNPPYTLQVSEILKEHHVRATFFLVGKALDARPDVARELLGAGDLLGNHSYHHDSYRWIYPGYPELEATQEAFKRDLGICPAFFRPPHGTHTPLMSRQAAKRGVTVVTWDVSAGDWATGDPVLVASRVLDRVKPGSIILLHDGRDGNIGADRSVLVDALPLILDGLGTRGLQPVTLDVLLRLPAYSDKC